MSSLHEDLDHSIRQTCRDGLKTYFYILVLEPSGFKPAFVHCVCVFLCFVCFLVINHDSLLCDSGFGTLISCFKLFFFFYVLHE